MKNAVILHGTSCTPDSFWQPSIKKFLQKRGYQVWVPALPNADRPDLKTWLPFVLTGGQFTRDTILIGHSSGGPLVLSVLENIEVTIHKAILVAGYARPKGKKKAPEAILQIDHILPRSRGGLDEEANLTVSCWECNMGKSNFII